MQVVRTTTVDSAGSLGSKSRSTKLSSTSVPRSPSRSDGRLEAYQKARRSVRVTPVMDRVEREILGRHPGYRIGAEDLVDRVDLHAVRDRHVGDHAILVPRLRQRDRLGGLLEQVHDRRAAQPERVEPDPLLQQRRRPSRGTRSPRAPSGIPRSGRDRSPTDVDEQELVWKREILRQQPVAQERGFGIREQALVTSESHLGETFFGLEPDHSRHFGRAERRPWLPG